MVPRIYGSLTSADPAAIGSAADRLVDAGVDGLHLDLADGHFIPYLTFGLPLVAELRHRLPEVVLDVHLMVERPEAYLASLGAAGVDRVAFHAEATLYPSRLVAAARRSGVACVGVAVNAASPLAVVPAHRSGLAFVNLQTSEPDESGECLLDGSVERVRMLRSTIGSELDVVVDGGVTVDNAAALIEAGASELVVGRALTASDDPRAVLRAIRGMAA